MSASERLRALNPEPGLSWVHDTSSVNVYKLWDALPLIADGYRLLERLREWDMLVGYIGADGEHHESTADAPYWRGEIDSALTALQGHLEKGVE